MSNPDQTPPRRGRAPIRRNVGQGSSSGRGGAPVPGQEPQPPAPHPAGRGITSEIPHGVQFGAVVEGQGMFYCSICDRYFDSDRGLCGHLRTHADRGYRGAFPPPTFTRQEFVDEGVEHLLNPLDGGDVAGQGGVAVEPPAAVGGEVGAPAGPNVEERAEGAAEASGEAERRRNLDLNAPPPRDESGDFI
ncbi:hypothetical protein RHSIM_Rhsim08G0027800 [Rhododendron simsii]|uniref:C2H2-type domain-containing protein n=1 Tax=Rhododendron simsii TaxID=118357 RepID=A0A834GNW0_RHOSS|nr:hypothetical protein RHSIM_Rhsim08G0027800 [Rhododendron simsii]